LRQRHSGGEKKSKSTASEQASVPGHGIVLSNDHWSTAGKAKNARPNIGRARKRKGSRPGIR
jgi:hypothetical protein